MICRFQFALALALAPLALGGSSTHPHLQVALRTQAEVKKNVIVLSDLLPENAPEDLRSAGASISLGSAPEPTSVRRISKGEIENALADHADLLAAVRIPEYVTVCRYHRALTASELATAIETALRREGATPASSLDVASLALSAPVYVTTDDPGLEVTEIHFDPLRRETRFRLWTTKEPRNLPFCVAISRDLKLPTLVARHDLAPGEHARPADFDVQTRTAMSEASAASLAPAQMAGLQARRLIHAGEVVNRSMFTREILAEPGLPAKLVVEGRGFRLETTVIPLERGVLGQQIRVRDPDTHRILAAEVVGKGKLQVQ